MSLLPTTLLPDTVRPASFDIQRHHKVLTSDPIVGAHRMQTRVIGEAYHTIKMKYDPMPRESYGALIPFLNNLRGQHDTFGVIIPNFTKGSTGLIEGNYITTTRGLTRQVLEAGNGPNDEVFTWTTTASNQMFSNAFTLSTFDLIAVYFDASGVAADTKISLWSSNTGTTGVIESDEFTVREGRNVFFLNPTLDSGNTYVRLSKVPTSVTGFSIKYGWPCGGVFSTTFAPAIPASHHNEYAMPLPAAVMNVSLNSPVQKVSYGADSLIRIELDLIERKL